MPWDYWWGGAHNAWDPLKVRHFFATDTLDYRAGGNFEI